jgi:hypothetical protein
MATKRETQLRGTTNQRKVHELLAGLDVVDKRKARDLLAQLDVATAARTANSAKDSSRTVADEDADHLDEVASCFALARAQIAAWRLVEREAPDFDALFGPKPEQEFMMLKLCFELDLASDALVVARVQVKRDRDEHITKMAWDERGSVRARRALHSFKLYVSDVDYAHAVVTPKESYVIPDFARLLSDRRSRFYRLVSARFRVDGEMLLHEDVELRATLCAMDCALLGTWLAAHDLCYLEHVYGLASPPPCNLPRLLSDADVVARFARDATFVRCFLRDDVPSSKYVSSAWRLRHLAVTCDHEETDPFMLVTPELHTDALHVHDKSGLIVNSDSVGAALVRYVELKREGCVFFEAQEGYHARHEAMAALFRLKLLARSMHLLADVRAAARAGPCPAYAELLPREEGRFVSPPPPGRYVSSAAEEDRWRAICRDGTKSEADLVVLRDVAIRLDLRGGTAAQLCQVIARQHEIEFGERARLREHAVRPKPKLARHTKAPTSEQVARLLACSSTSSASSASPSSIASSTPPSAK